MLRLFYPTMETGQVHPAFAEEADFMASKGLCLSTSDIDQCDCILYRGPNIKSADKYPQLPNMPNNWENCISTILLSKYYPLIENLTIPTFFANDLNDDTINEIKRRGWDKAFIKNDAKSLFAIRLEASVWPDTSFEEMKELFKKYASLSSLYAIREYIPYHKFYDEKRYWILNHHPYSPYGEIPLIIKEAAERLKPLGSRYYTIDAIDNLIVEVNPGESSDRGCEVPLECLLNWFIKEFDNA